MSCKVVVGPGAMGCLIAGFLKENVWLLDEHSKRAQAIDQNGVIIEDDDGSRVIPVNATADPKQIPSANFVFLCVKSYDTESAIKSCLGFCGPETIIITLQNGLGNDECIARYVEAHQIVCGTSAHGSTSLGDGHVRHAGSGDTVLAPYLPDSIDKAEAAAALLCSVGIEASTTPDATSLKWSKLIINAAINPLTAISNVRNGLLLKDRHLRETMTVVVSETAEVAKKSGIKLLYGDEIRAVEEVCEATANNTSSMLQDIQSGKKTEIDFITGMIVKVAKINDVDVPASEMLLDEIHKLEKENK